MPPVSRRTDADHGKVGLNRLEAAEWVRRHTGYALWNTTLRNWERFGFLRNQTPGRRNPACYTVPDLVAAAGTGSHALDR